MPGAPEADHIVGESFDVFISYAHADREAESDRSPAETLATLLMRRQLGLAATS